MELLGTKVLKLLQLTPVVKSYFRGKLAERESICLFRLKIKAKHLNSRDLRVALKSPLTRFPVCRYIGAISYYGAKIALP